MWFLLVMCYSHGVCVEPTNPRDQQVLWDALERLLDPSTPGCRKTNMDSCSPWIVET